MLISLASNILVAAEDPTRPPGRSSYQAADEPQKIKLQGLVFGENSWVVINNIVIREGETKQAIKVINVKKDKVLIRRYGENIWLQWKKMAIKKTKAELIK
jgi:hypothetical protein